MQVRSEVMVFVGGRRLRVDPATGLTDPFTLDVEEGKPLSKHLHPADGSKPVRSSAVPGQAAAPVKAGKLTKKEIMAQLSAAGVKYNATMTAEALLALLDAEKAKAAPAASTAPSKEPGAAGDPPVSSKPSSTGDQDVI